MMKYDFKKWVTKPQLRALPSDERPAFDGEHDYSVTATVHVIDDHEILRLEVWERTGRKLVKFMDYIARRDLTLLYGEKWSEGSLSYQLGDWRLTRRLYVPEAAALVIGNYFNDFDTAPAYLLYINDEMFRSARYRARTDRRLKIIRHIADERKPLPSDFYSWCHNQLFGKKHFLLYTRSGSEIKGTCTHCGHYVSISAKPGMKHGTDIICPSCRRKVQMISPGKYKRSAMRDDKYAVFVHRVEEGLLLRSLRVCRNIDLCTAKVSMYTEELAMYLVSADSRNDINMEYYRHMRDGNGYWCWDTAIKESWSHAPLFKPGRIYTANLKRELKGTCWEYCALELLPKVGYFDGGSIALYLCNARYNPMIERLMRVKCYNLARSTIVYTQNESWKKKLHQYLGVSKEDVRFFAKINITHEEYCAFMSFKKNGVSEPAKLLEHMRKSKFTCLSTAEALLQRISGKVFERLYWDYAPRQVKLQKYKTVGLVLMDYHDYMIQVDELRLDKNDTSVMWPEKLRERHAQLSLRIQRGKEQVTDKAIRHRWKTERQKFEYSNGEYCVVFPRCHADLITEGKSMSNCVATYASRVARHTTTVVFVRKVSAKNDSFCTAEIDNDYDTRQLRGKFNHDPEEAVETFWEEYEKNVLVPLKNQTSQRKVG